MDLLSSIRKSGSRGGVNFSWDEVQTSQHRENYLGHSLMAPVGRWQKGKDLSWYAKGDDTPGEDGETAEQKSVRERKEEIRRIKEAEEDALARALGLPVADRNVSGANAISVGEVNRMVKEVGVGEEEDGGGEGRSKGFGDFVGKLDGREAIDTAINGDEKGGLVKKGREKERDGKRKDDGRERRSSRERRHRQHRHRSRSGDRRRHRSRSGDRHSRHGREDRDDKEGRRPRRSRSPERRERRYRSRSPDGRTKDREDRGRYVERSRRSRSPASREHRARRYS
ncbi:uncharacterized protein LY89DRAFT_688862 [Mollisia scopiformis]|uniref:Multiple myeloma tumor-associated protein 2-like N-terminal domain-containing protein n=1 Tax=Mollisia scopiformis TaxID=149040 RepID=A0A194WUQ1_MOLSC|nr:uncharacterized protein LY89DRAFT_688862 [Mollisia scopiformis]KUJ11688.1 hypothetical protein LY89DRAFT_688862 [Mollisia scopiformis]